MVSGKELVAESVTNYPEVTSSPLKLVLFKKKKSIIYMLLKCRLFVRRCVGLCSGCHGPQALFSLPWTGMPLGLRNLAV